MRAKKARLPKQTGLTPKIRDDLAVTTATTAVEAATASTVETAATYAPAEGISAATGTGSISAAGRATIGIAACAAV